MKINPATPQIIPLLSATVLVGILSFSQPADSQPATAPRINPENGLPMLANPNPTHFEPLVGTPPNLTNLPNDFLITHTASEASIVVHELISNGRYDDALQMCLFVHDQFKTSGAMGVLIPQWIELGRRFPKAREALVKIRDHDLSEFSEDRGYCDLFGEVDALNHGLRQDDSTYALFKTLREKDPDLAQQCFPYVEGLLVAKGEYQWCYDHMGDPQGVFDVIHRNMDLHLADQKRMAELRQETAQRMEAFNRQHGQTNAWSQPDYASNALKQFAHDDFVGRTRQLIEILVATHHKPNAEKIRDQAVALLDDPRLQSAVSDAEEKIRQAGANAEQISK